MAFSIKDENVDKDVRRLASLTGESLTRAVAQAVKERIERIKQAKDSQKEGKRKQLARFLKNRPRLHYKGKRALKDIRDELWEP